jgi:hypothetical protein
MHRGLILGAGLLALCCGCQACSNCSDYAPPATFTAPGEVYADNVLPAGPPIVSRGIVPSASEPAPASPLPSPSDSGMSVNEVP